MRNHRDSRNNKELFSIRTKLSYHKFFTEYLLAKEMKKTQILMNKPVYLGLPVLEWSKINVWVLLWLCKIKIVP